LGILFSINKEFVIGSFDYYKLKSITL